MTRLLQNYSEVQADTRPSATAVVLDGRTLTYGELDTLSTQLAGLLKDDGCQPGDRVALLMPKGPLALVGLLGIYKADGVYVPVDPASPARRLESILEICGSRWVLAGGSATSALDTLARSERRLRIGWLDPDPPPLALSAAFTLADVARRPATRLAYRNVPDDPAHILFTSGSTGTPKGVVITHANVSHFIDWATEYLALDRSDRLSSHAPLHFDLSFLDIFGAFSAGAELHVVPASLGVFPHQLADFIRKSELTQWFSVPSVLAYLAQFGVVRQGDFPAMKRVLWCGDVLATPVLRHWMERVPHAAFINLYGPTEATVASSVFRVAECPADPAAAIPIGVACVGEELLVLDDAMNVLPPETVGDLYIAGVGLARGYWQDPAQTAAAFLPHPYRPGERIYRTGDLARVGRDGQVYFLGRSDSQIKSRGYRIELGEIEAAVNGVAGIHESAIVAVDSGRFDGAAICGAYVLTPGSDLTMAGLNRQLQDVIPSYMLPSRWLNLDALPRTQNGKTDRRQLKRMFEQDLADRAAHSA